MIELSYSTTVKILDDLVEEFGSDYVYEAGPLGACNYIRKGEPSCIVGHVLVKVGVPVKRLKVADGPFGGGMGAHVLLDGLKEEGVIQFDGSVRSLLREAQYSQDNGNTWGRSVEVAKSLSQP